MTIQLKSSLIIIATLLLGMGIGLWGGIQLTKSEMAAMQQTKNAPKGIVRMLENHIKPTPEQREAIIPIVKKYRPRFKMLRQTQRQEWAKVADSLLRDIDPILTDKQRMRIARKREQFKKRTAKEQNGNAESAKQEESYRNEKEQ